jgi:hypothetical protein
MYHDLQIMGLATHTSVKRLLQNVAIIEVSGIQWLSVRSKEPHHAKVA